MQRRVGRVILCKMLEEESSVVNDQGVRGNRYAAIVCSSSFHIEVTRNVM